MNRLPVAGVIFVVIAAVPLHSSAQSPAEAEPQAPQASAEQMDTEARIFQIRHADGAAIARILQVFNVPVRYEADLRVITVRAPATIMPAIEDIINRFDVPSTATSVELTVYVLMASDRPEASRAIPAELEPVITQLRNVLSYKDFYLADTLITRVADGRAVQLDGALNALSDVDISLNALTFYNLRVHQARIVRADDRATTVQLNQMRFALRVPMRQSETLFNYVDLSISTDVEIAAGQQVVVGKTTVGEKAVILVMNASF